MGFKYRCLPSTRQKLHSAAILKHVLEWHIFRTAYNANLKHISEWRIFQNGRVCKKGPLIQVTLKSVFSDADKIVGKTWTPRLEKRGLKITICLHRVPVLQTPNGTGLNIMAFFFVHVYIPGIHRRTNYAHGIIEFLTVSLFYFM